MPDPSEAVATHLRPYDDARDRGQVREICRNVYGGTDRIPHLLPHLAASTSDYPLVLIDTASDTVVAFVNLARRFSRASAAPLFLLEAIRVAEHARGRGLGTAITAAAQLHAQRLSHRTASVRIMTTTIPDNRAAARIFDKLQFLPRGICHIWPHPNQIRHLRTDNAAKGAKFHSALEMLDELRIVLPLSSSSACWTQVRDKTFALEIVRRMSASSGSELFPLWYTPATAEDLVDPFLDPGGLDRSVWILQREREVPAIAFVAIDGNGGHIRDHFASAVVADLDAAEALIAFLAQFSNLGAFCLALDMTLTPAKISQSRILGSVQTDPFIIYESAPES